MKNKHFREIYLKLNSLLNESERTKKKEKKEDIYIYIYINQGQQLLPMNSLLNIVFYLFFLISLLN